MTDLDVLYNSASVGSRLDWSAVPDLTGYGELTGTVAFMVRADDRLDIADGFVVAAGTSRSRSRP